MVILCLLLVFLPGCVTRDAKPAVELAMDREEPRLWLRVESAWRVSEQDADQLMPLVTEADHRIELRQAAVDRMLECDASGFWRKAWSNSVWISDWPMIRLLALRAQTTRSPDAIPWLVMSWASPSIEVADPQRPEAKAIEAITSQPARNTLKRLAFSASPAEEARTPVAAWTILARTQPDGWLRAQLSEVDRRKSHDWLGMLQDAADSVDLLPADRLALQRLAWLYEQVPAESWQDWASMRKAHAGDGPATLSLRQLPAVSHLPNDWRSITREQWIERVRDGLADAAHIHRGTDAEDEVVIARPSMLEDHLASLGLFDLVVLGAMLDVRDDRSLAKALFAQADNDRVDRSAEHGGVILWDSGGRLRAEPFEPDTHKHDRAYYASEKCIRAGALGLANYHFHATGYDNAIWAGPGNADMEFVDRHHANGIVFTFIDHDTLNADAYFPGGIVIDLGCITRP